MATIAKSRISLILLVTMLAASILLNYVDRGAIGISAPLMTAELGLTATQFGIAVSAFFWIYAPIQLLVGWLCDRYCVYRIFALGLIVWALSTIATAFVGGFAMLLALRLLLGLGESIAFPGSAKIIAAEVPATQRGLANAMIAAALAFGPALGTFAGGTILDLHGWRAVFLTFGLVTLLWLVPWHFISRPFRAATMANSTPPPRVLGLSRKPQLWWSSAAHFCSNYAFYFLLAWLPLYLTKNRGMSIPDMTAMTTAVFVAQGIAALTLGWLSDHLVRSGADEGHVRRMLMLGAQIGISVSILGAARAATDAALFGWLILGGIAIGVSATNIFAVAQIFAGPRAAGSWVGVQNAFGNTSGIVGPIVTGLIIDHTGSYFAAFALAASVAGAGAAIWLLALRKVEELRFD